MTELHRVIELAASPIAVWERLWDIHALAGCIPGCGDVEAIEERRRYRATIRDKVGPFRIAIPLEILSRPRLLSDWSSPRRAATARSGAP